jgi:hypothetical protein
MGGGHGNTQTAVYKVRFPKVLDHVSHVNLQTFELNVREGLRQIQSVVQSLP